MIKNFEWMIAWRYLKPQRKEGVVSIIAAFSFFGIMLGVATLIIVMAVMNGFREELMNKILSFNGHISVYSHKTNTGTDSLLQQIQKLPHVQNAHFFIDQQALAFKNNAMAGVQIRAIDFKDLKTNRLFKEKIQLQATDGEFPGVYLGRRLADKLGVDLGHVFQVFIPQKQTTAFGRLPRSKKCIVSGIFSIGMSVYDEAFMFVPLAVGENLFQTTHKNIEIFLETPLALNKVLPALQSLVKNTPELYIMDWQNSNTQFFNAIKIERNVMFLILTLIIIVAAFNIISSMIMMVKDKKLSIAILRTMGVSKRSILTIFFLTGSFIGFTGTFMGVVLGLGFAYNIERIRQCLERICDSNLFSAEIYFLSQLPAIVKIEDVVLITVMAIVLCFIATFYPSWRATLIDPAEILRYG